MPLVLTRKEGEYIRIYGPAIVRVHQIAGNRVRLLIEAEQDVTVLRGEVLEDARYGENAKALDRKQSARRKRGTPEP